MDGPMMRMMNMTCCIRALAERRPWNGTAARMATPCAGLKKLEMTLMAARAA